MTPLIENKFWKELIDHQIRLKNTTILDLFNQSHRDRSHQFSLKIADLELDFSKNIIDQTTLDCLVQLAESINLADSIQAMFRGDKINFTENRAVLHTALRDMSDQEILVDGIDVKRQINKVLEQMTNYSDSINDGKVFGATGKVIKNIINIGIGGSDLGPASAYLALKDYVNKKIIVRFISNIDYSDFSDAIEGLDPAETIFIISSKTFTTDETMTNALTAKEWVINTLGDEAIKKHFIAVSTNVLEVEKFGIDRNNIFEFWDFVGGRYSLCSSIGLSLMIAIGSYNFKLMQEGFYEVDQHFKNSPLSENGPVLMALLSVWYGNFWKSQTEALIPYSHRLSRLPAYLQQATMESNGKNIDINGKKISYQTSPILWGEPGTNAQHAFFQLFHQGTELVPIDFIGFKTAYDDGHQDHQFKLLANMLAQAEALAFGEKQSNQEMNNDKMAIFRSFYGNKPSTVILGSVLNPKTFGEIIALYEHKIFVEGLIWQINSFDQFGVELGKKLAKNIYLEMSNKESISHHDSSTADLIQMIVNN